MALVNVPLGTPLGIYRRQLRDNISKMKGSTYQLESSIIS